MSSTLCLMGRKNTVVQAFVTDALYIQMVQCDSAGLCEP